MVPGVLLTVATKDLQVLQAARSLNKNMSAPAVFQELGSQLCLVAAELIRTG